MSIFTTLRTFKKDIELTAQQSLLFSTFSAEELELPVVDVLLRKEKMKREKAAFYSTKRRLTGFLHHDLERIYSNALDLYDNVFNSEPSLISEYAYQTRGQSIYEGSKKFLHKKRELLGTIENGYKRRGTSYDPSLFDTSHDEHILNKIKTDFGITEHSSPQIDDDYTTNPNTTRHTKSLQKQRARLQKKEQTRLQGQATGGGGGASLQKLPDTTDELIDSGTALQKLTSPLSKTSYASVASSDTAGLGKIPWTLDRQVSEAEFTHYSGIRQLLGVDVFNKKTRAEKWKPVVDGALARIESGTECTDQDRFNDLNILQMDFFQRINHQDFLYNELGITIDTDHVRFLGRLRNAFGSGAKAGDTKASEVLVDMNNNLRRILNPGAAASGGGGAA